MDNINILLIIVLACFILYGLWGYYRGFIKTVLLLCAFVLSAILAYILTPYVSDFFTDHTPMHSAIQSRCVNYMQENLKLDLSDKMNEAITELVEELPVPDQLKENIKKNSKDAGNELIKDTGIYEFVGKELANFAVHGISFFLLFAVLEIIFRIIIHLTDAINRVPVLGKINKIAGLLLGLLKALLIVWIAFAVFTLLMDFSFGAQQLKNIQDSIVLRFLYNNDIFIKMLM